MGPSPEKPRPSAVPEPPSELRAFLGGVSRNATRRPERFPARRSAAHSDAFFMLPHNPRAFKLFLKKNAAGKANRVLRRLPRAAKAAGKLPMFARRKGRKRGNTFRTSPVFRASPFLRAPKTARCKKTGERQTAFIENVAIAPLCLCFTANPKILRKSPVYSVERAVGEKGAQHLPSRCGFGADG